MPDFQVVDPKGWDYDLHSVFTAYIGYFQMQNIPWYDRSWGHLFFTFDSFLSFEWPVITVTDTWTGRPHIVTRLTSIGAFIKMVKTRYGAVLPQPPNISTVSAFETSTRALRQVASYTMYQKLFSTLPAIALQALKSRLKAGDPKAVAELWNSRKKTFLAIDFEWSERNEKTVLEWGYAAVRCGHLNARGHWPPNPNGNYRNGHYVVEEYADKIVNRHSPTFPWNYAYGDSQVLSKTSLPRVIQAVISSLATPESETISNDLVLIAHGINGDLQRLQEMQIRIPHNVMIIDTSVYERVLFNTGQRANASLQVFDPKTNTLKTRQPGSTLSLENLLRSLSTPTRDVPTLHNAGNDALMVLYAFQKLFEQSTEVPAPTTQLTGRRPGVHHHNNNNRQSYIGGGEFNGGQPIFVSGLAIVDEGAFKAQSKPRAERRRSAGDALSGWPSGR